MKKSSKKLYICSCLFLLIGTGNAFSQIRWDSVPGKFQWSNAVRVMYADSDYIYAAGQFNEVGGIHAKGIVRWNGVRWDSMGAGIDGLDTLNSYPNNTLTITNYQGKLYVGGVFMSVGEAKAPCIGRWDGTSWDSLPIQPFTNNNTEVVDAMATINNKLYVGGRFDTVAGQPGIFDIACWNGTNWSSLNFPNYGKEYFEAIDAICEYKGSIYVGGTFYDSIPTDSTANILRYDSTGWHAVGGGIKGGADEVWSMVVYNGELYVAGYFSQADGNAGNNIQKWDGTKWSDVSGGTDNEIFHLMVYNGKLYAMGEVDAAGGIPTSKIAEWDGSKWCSLGSTFDNSIGTGCVYKDSLYIGGGFWTIDGDSINYIAEWTGGDYTSNCENVTGVSEVSNSISGMLVYPNPNNGMFTIQANSQQSAGADYIQVYNVLGQQVYQSSINANSTEINLSGQPQGVYLYRVITETGNLVGEGKVLKE